MAREDLITSSNAFVTKRPRDNDQAEPLAKQAIKDKYKFTDEQLNEYLSADLSDIYGDGTTWRFGGKDISKEEAAKIMQVRKDYKNGLKFQKKRSSADSQVKDTSGNTVQAKKDDSGNIVQASPDAADAPKSQANYVGNDLKSVANAKPGQMLANGTPLRLGDIIWAYEKAYGKKYPGVKYKSRFDTQDQPQDNPQKQSTNAKYAGQPQATVDQMKGHPANKPKHNYDKHVSMLQRTAARSNRGGAERQLRNYVKGADGHWYRKGSL